MNDRVVLWDFDGTLAERDGRWRGALLQALTVVDPTHGVTVDALRPGLQDGFLWHQPEVPHLELDTPVRWWAHATPLFERAYLLAGVTPDTARRAALGVADAYLDLAAWRVFGDVRPCLTQLKDAGWRHVIVSNHVPELPQLVADLGLADLFDEVVVSAQTGYEKPHPEMYAIARARAGHPQQVWMVGDNPVADVAGAEAAGIPAILVRTPAEDGTVRELEFVVRELFARA